MMVRLCIHEVARRRGLSLTQFQRSTNLPMTTARRYWYGSKTGLARDAGTLREVNLATLEMIATMLCVQPSDLLAEQGEGSHE